MLHSPILGDGRYALLRSADQQWFQARLTEAPAVPGERAEQTLGMALRCNRHLQLHCFQVGGKLLSRQIAYSASAPNLWCT